MLAHDFAFNETCLISPYRHPTLAMQTAWMFSITFSKYRIAIQSPADELIALGPGIE